MEVLEFTDDFIMKTKEELNTLKEEDEALNNKLTEEELTQVTGGITQKYDIEFGEEDK